MDLKALKPVAKMIVAALGAGLAVLFTALTDEVVTAQEWIGVVLGVLGVGGGTYAVPNVAPDEHYDYPG